MSTDFTGKGSVEMSLLLLGAAAKDRPFSCGRSDLGPQCFSSSDRSSHSAA